MHKYSKKPKQQKELAKKRIATIMQKADEIFDEAPEYSDKYVQLARKIGMKFKVRLSKEDQRKFCKHCYSYLRPGVNCRVRQQTGKQVYYCQSCKKFMRFPLKSKTKKTAFLTNIIFY